MRTLGRSLLVSVFLMFGSRVQASAQPGVQSGYFPLALGTEWEFSVYLSILDTVVRHDTVKVDDVYWSHGKKYYHLTTPWFPLFDIWVRPDFVGNLLWCQAPGDVEHTLFDYSSGPGEGWLMNRGLCTDSVTTTSCDSPAVTPIGSFDDLKCVESRWREGDCTDVLWASTFARDTGPLRWIMTGAGGASVIWELVEYRPTIPKSCKCHGDPVCDGVHDIRDLVTTVNVAFRGGQQSEDRGCSYYARALHGRSDVDCSGTTNITDVILTVDVVFRGADPATKFCEP